MNEVLREETIKRFGNQVNSARDCNRLSEIIAIQTGRKISPTTLRRFFGLLPSKTSFSKYNLNTLAIFAGSISFEDFSKKFRENSTPLYSRFDEITENLRQITNYTLTSISRKSLSDFKNTIQRKQVNEKLNSFIDSNYIIYPMIAPGGYGKSTSLAHWIISGNDKDLRFFCPASIFYSMAFPVEKTQKPFPLQIDISDNVFNQFLNNTPYKDRKLILVLDALDEISTEPEKLIDLVNYIFDIAAKYADKGLIKIIFSIRENAWHNYLDKIFSKFRTTRWFEDYNLMLESGFTNLEPLSNSEIKEITSKYNSHNESKFILEYIPWNILETIRIPINLHFVIELFREGKSPEKISQAEITREFIKEFVFQGKYAEQKKDLIWTIIKLRENSGDKLFINKNEIKKRYPIHLKRETAYYQAYNDLLHFGIISEEREENRYGIFLTKVGFKHQNLFYYLFSLYLIRKNGGLDFKLFSTLAKSEHHALWASHIIGILYEIAYDNEDYEALENFCKLPENILEALPVKLSVGNSFRKHNAIREKLIKKFASTRAGRMRFFEHYVDINYIFNNYKLRITEYLKHETNLEPLLFGNCILFLAGLLKLNKDDCENHFKAIREINPDKEVHPWPIGRKVTSHTLHDYFIRNGKLENLNEFIHSHSSIAFAYKGYLARGRIEFEMSVMVALVLVQEFQVLKEMLENALKSYSKISNQKQEKINAWWTESQNRVSICFLKYANYKLNKYNTEKLPGFWIKSIESYALTYDDFQYLILLNWFLTDYYNSEGCRDKAAHYHSNALEISRFAEYDFFIAFLLKNDPLKRTEFHAAAEQMLIHTDFDIRKFHFQPGSFS